MSTNTDKVVADVVRRLQTKSHAFAVPVVGDANNDRRPGEVVASPFVDLVKALRALSAPRPRAFERGVHRADVALALERLLALFQAADGGTHHHGWVLGYYGALLNADASPPAVARRTAEIAQSWLDRSAALGREPGSLPQAGGRHG